MLPNATTSSSSRLRPLRRLRHGSPESKHSRLLGSRHHTSHGQGAMTGSQQAAEELDIVNRQADGSYLLGESGNLNVGAKLPAVFGGRGTEEDEDDEEAMVAKQDQQFAEIARQYFASGGKVEKKIDEEREQSQAAMLMLRLREQVAAKIEGERWLYETVDRAHAGFS